MAAAEGESNFVWLSKTNLFFVGIGKCALLMRIVHQTYVFMIRVQALFNDRKDLFSIVIHF